MSNNCRSVARLVAVAMSTAHFIYAAGHGPVFGLATPTNPAGGWSLDLSQMFRYSPDGTGAMMRAELGYGITENVKLAVSAPAVFAAEPLPPARVSAFTPMGGDFEAL